MWIFANDAFLSIVAHRNPDRLWVRARRAQDIRNVFPDAAVAHTPGRDYAYRSAIKRKTVERAMAQEIRRIDYTNFKDSIEDEARHDACSEVWSVMMRWGRGMMRRPTLAPVTTYRDPYDTFEFRYDENDNPKASWRTHEQPLGNGKDGP